MFRKKLLSLILAGILALNLAVPVVATDVGVNGNTGNTPVEVTADAATFSVTVPTSSEGNCL